MKAGDKVVVVKPDGAELINNNNEPFWVEGMDRYIGKETKITSTMVLSDDKKIMMYYIECCGFVWRAEWLFVDEQKKLPIEEVIENLEAYIMCDYDEYTAALEELINVHMVCDQFSDALTKAVETQLRGALKYFEANFNIKKRTIDTPSYTENYLEAK